VTTAKEAAKEGRVYILDQGATNTEPFQNAGFEVVPVEAGLLYELVPPGREPYAQNAG